MDNKKSQGSSIGQFDLIKGIGIICIIIKHSIGLFDATQLFSATAFGLILGVLVKIFNNMMMPAFFIISGFGFRKDGIKKSLKKQAGYLLIPYIIVTLVTCVLNLVIHYSVFHYKRGAVEETLKVFGGFALGAARSITIGGIMFFANGACWYLLALFVAWIILSVIFEFCKKWQAAVVAAIVVCGWILSIIWPECVYGIPQAMIGVGYLYIGYEMKKKKWLYDTPKLWEYVIMVIAAIVTVCFGNVIMADNLWKLGIIDIVANALYAMLFIRGMVKLGRISGNTFSPISYMGRMSLWIICLHTVEFIAIPWYLLTDIVDSNIINLIIIIILRSIIIATGIVILKIRMKIKFRLMRKVADDGKR